ncbi:MAG TPA: branched-chain amino acid ABC transporter permease [Dehalococcoidia bacterium]|nr:branched-chain amino acid ABC transporter permease [Dehalococcoidia bacterium]
MQTFKNNKKLFGFILLIILLALVPVFIKSPYYLDLFTILLVNVMIAMTFVMMLRAGLISLGLATFWGVGAYVSALLVMKVGMSFWLSLPLTAIITAAVALLLGLLLVKSGGFTFLILTAVLGMLFVVVVNNIDYVGGATGISNIPPPNSINLPFLPAIEFTSKPALFYLALFIFVIVLLIVKAFYAAWTGRAWTSIGFNPRLASSLGISVYKHQLLCFTVASAIGGLLGSFYAHYQGFIVPVTFSFFVTIYAQIHAILGGFGYVVMGPLVGAAIMKFVPEFLRIAENISPIIVGTLLIVLILFLPRGILGLLDRDAYLGKLWNKFGQKLEAALSNTFKAKKV